jgi:hypothetical protein
MTMDRSDGGMLYVPTIMCKEDDRRFLCPFLFTRKCAGVKRRPWDLKLRTFGDPQTIFIV